MQTNTGEDNQKVRHLKHKKKEKQLPSTAWSFSFGLLLLLEGLYVLLHGLH